MEQIIKSLGWNHLAFLFAIFFVVFFRKSVSSLITRITSIDRSGIKLAQDPESQKEKQKEEAVQELLLAIGDSIVLREVENNIKIRLKEKGLGKEDDTIKVLIKHLAAANILVEFEQIHNLIFGSQIFLLKRLNETAGQGKTIEFVDEHLKHVKSMFPEQLGNWKLEQYLSFLLNRSLVTTNGNVFHITNLGVEYLTWMTRNGRVENRPL